MSMWEIEALVEDGINLVDKTELPNEEKIKLIGNLYAIQEIYDCSFTNFRVMPILLKTGYTKTIHYTEHPDYAGNETWFQKLLRKDEIEFINRDIKKRWSKKNDVAAYLEKETGNIYIDYGSPLRSDEPPLQIMHTGELALTLIRAAHQLQDKGLVYDWTAYLLKLETFAWSMGDDTAEELIDRYFREIKAIWRSYDYSDYEPIKGFELYLPGSGKSDGFNEYALSGPGIEGDILRYFFDVE